MFRFKCTCSETEFCFFVVSLRFLLVFLLVSPSRARGFLLVSPSLIFFFAFRGWGSGKAGAGRLVAPPCLFPEFSGRPISTVWPAAGPAPSAEAR